MASLLMLLTSNLFVMMHTSDVDFHSHRALDVVFVMLIVMLCQKIIPYCSIPIIFTVKSQNYHNCAEIVVF